MSFARTRSTLVQAARSALRVAVRVLVRTLYRLHVSGGERIPRRGGALLVANHVSYVDALLLAASTDRPVRFLMLRRLYHAPLLGWFARLAGAIPVASSDSPEEKHAALAGAARRAAAGELVCIFAEGAITRSGALQRFRRGLETIGRAAGVPIVPVALTGVWGSVFSFEGGRALWKLPKRVPYPVGVRVGAPLPACASARDVECAVRDLLVRVPGGAPRVEAPRPVRVSSARGSS